MHGIEPQYQFIRTLDIERGRSFQQPTTKAPLRVAIVGAEAARQLFRIARRVGQAISLNNLPFTIVGIIRKKDQDSSYSGPDNDKVFVPFAAMLRDFPRLGVEPDVISQI